MTEQYPTEANPKASALEAQQDYQDDSGVYSQALPVTQPLQDYHDAQRAYAAAEDSTVVPVSQFNQLQHGLNTLRSQLSKGQVSTIRTNVTTIGPGNKVYIKTDQASTRRRDTDHCRVKLQGEAFI